VLKREVVSQFLASRLYMLGMACDLCGALLVGLLFARTFALNTSISHAC
jgi:hypothetical protein